MQEILGFHKFCAWWVPKELTEEHKHNCVGTRSPLMEQYDKEGDGCSNFISDETSICYYKHKADAKYAMEAPVLSCPKKFKTQTLVERSMLT
jgi:hypothetical protein